MTKKTTKPTKKKINTTTTIEQLITQSEQLQTALTLAQEKEKRSLADYQNLLRRTQQERSKQAQLATLDLVTALLMPFEHLSLAAAEIDDQGLNMVIDQLWQVLSGYGLEEIPALGEIFDINYMEAVDKGKQGKKVVEVVKKGFRLNGVLIQHAKVLLD